jgi:lauroyl/myristoyl acyltransferase
MDALVPPGMTLLGWAAWLVPWQVWHLVATAVGALGMCFRWRRIVLANVRHVRSANPPSRPVAWYIGMQQIANHFKAVIALLRSTAGSGARADPFDTERFEEMEPHLGRRGIVTVAPHAGPYVAFGMMIMPWFAARGFSGPVAVVVRLARPFGSDAPQRWLESQLDKAGVIAVRADGPSDQVARTLLTVLRANGIVVLLVDEPSPAPSIETPFFDNVIRMPVGPARLARATGSVIIPFITTYGKSRTSRLTFAPAIEPPPPRERPDGTLRTLAAALEGLISAHLDQWSMLTPIWDGAREQAPPEGYSYADLHLHTPASDGLCSIDDWVGAAPGAGVKLIGIMDHDSVEALRAWQERPQAADGARRVVAGVELTARGRIVHVGVLFPGRLPDKLPKRDTPLVEIVRWARTIEGSVVVLVHPLPFLWRRQLRKLARANALPDAIETRFPLVGWRTRRIEAAAASYRLAVVGGTDAHLTPGQLGQHVVMFPGETPEDLFAALRSRTTRAVTRPAGASPPRELYLLQAVYSWLLPFNGRPLVARARGRVLKLAQERARRAERRCL